MPGACARAFLSFLVLACGRWGSAAPPWALVVVAVPRCREWPLFCASAPSVPRPSPMHRPWRRRPLACRSFMSVSRASPSGAVPYAGSVWGFCTTRGCDTPATLRQRASCSAKPPSHQIGDRAGRNSRRRRCGVRGIVWARLLTKWPPHQVASSPSGLLPKASPRPPLHKFRMQFPDGANRRKLKNRGISTIRLQNLKHSQGNCMRNCWTPRCLPPEKLHVIPPGPHSTTARKPRNFNDPISIFETSSGELRAKLLCPSAAGPGHTRTKSRPIGEAAAMPAGNMGMAAEPVRGGRARVRLKINHAEQSSRRGRRAGRLRGGRRLGGLPRGTAHPDR